MRNDTMSNTNSSVTKLRGNETSKNHGQNQPNSDRSLQADYVASGSLHYSNPEINTLAHQHKYRGRGMAIQRLAESMASKGRMKNSNLNLWNQMKRIGENSYILIEILKFIGYLFWL
ncbi:uncharacterized protein LOC111036305 isoform X3 [Myzus persicae]|uniref:uncharacterized protein LOC111036305 isoform X3 n=1 Tax=Myzus persicae TaxID=13164 RepID=UPI000B935701|nr:uncharacterized protein LOC111036305 isoform X3 [Myzus persicae]